MGSTACRLEAERYNSRMVLEEGRIPKLVTGPLATGARIRSHLGGREAALQVCVVEGRRREKAAVKG